MLPEMSGYDVLLKLRDNKIYTPVLILTAKDSISDKLKGFRYGADAVSYTHLIKKGNDKYEQENNFKWNSINRKINFR